MATAVWGGLSRRKGARLCTGVPGHSPSHRSVSVKADLLFLFFLEALGAIPNIQALKQPWGWREKREFSSEKVVKSRNHWIYIYTFFLLQVKYNPRAMPYLVSIVGLGSLHWPFYLFVYFSFIFISWRLIHWPFYSMLILSRQCDFHCTMDHGDKLILLFTLTQWLDLVKWCVSNPELSLTLIW